MHASLLCKKELLKPRTALLALLALALMVAACRAGPTPTTVPTATRQAPTSTPTEPAPDPTPTVTATVEPTPTEMTYQPVFEEAACPFDIPPGQVEGQTVECGYLVVPEDRSVPEARTIRLAVAVFHPPGGPSKPDPIIYLSGGPGGSALELIYYSYLKFAPVLAEGRDLILFDQRGVGLSEPALDCPAVLTLSFDLLDHEIDGKKPTDEEAFELFLQAFESCQQDLSQVADLSAYHTAASAADVNDLRLALGYEGVNLWGGSYGTRLALEVMRDYPEGLRSVVLDSVYPPDVNLYLESPANLDRAMDALFESCAADEVCNAAYPNLRTVFFETVDRLNESPVSGEITDPFAGKSYEALLDGDTLLALLFQLLYDTDALSLLPQMIYDASQGDFDLIHTIRGTLIGQAFASSRGMMFSVQCHEELVFGSRKEFEAISASYPELAAVFEYSVVGGLAFEVCTSWGAGRADDLENRPISSDVPTLVLAGEFDPITPPAWARRAAETLSKGYAFEYPGVGHGASLARTCPRSMMLAFLDDPTRKPDDTCMAEMGIQFATRYTDPEGQFTSLVLPGWSAEYADGYGVLTSQEDDITIYLLAVEGKEIAEASKVAWARVKPDFDLEPAVQPRPCAGCAASDAEQFAFVHYDTGGEQRFILGIGWLYEGVVYLLLWDADPDAIEENTTQLNLLVTRFTITALRSARQGEKATPSPVEETGADVEVTLVPFTSDEFGISGLVPEGWPEVAAGTFMRGSSPTDQTAIIQKAFPGTTIEEFTPQLLPALRLKELPEPVATHESEALTWTLYAVEIEAPGVGTFVVDVALSETEEATYLILFQVLKDDYDALHEAVFLPAVEALAPTE